MQNLNQSVMLRWHNTAKPFQSVFVALLNNALSRAPDRCHAAN